MEILTIILSGLLAAISPLGIILDQIIASRIRSQVKGVEVLAVRVDNVPSYQIIQGKVQKVRIATRGMQPLSGFRIDTLELETDPIHVDLPSLQSGGLGAIGQSFKEPIQGGVRLVLTEADVNQSLQSPEVLSFLQETIDNAIGDSLPGGQKFKILQSRVDFLENNRLRVEARLVNAEEQLQDDRPIEIVLEVGIKPLGTKKIELIDPTGTLNGRRLSSRLLGGFAQTFSERFDLGSFEERGITARVLKFIVDNERLHLVAFFRLEAARTGDDSKKEQ